MKPDLNIPPKSDTPQPPFKVPNGYFENLEDQIMQEVGGNKKGAKVPLTQMVRPYLWIAALFLGTFFLFRGVINFISPTSQNTINQISTLTTEDLDAISLELSEYEIIEFMDENTLSNSISN